MTEAPAPSDMLIRLSPSEVELVRTALRLLRNTLGRDEADELAAVMVLLERLDVAGDDREARA